MMTSTARDALVIALLSAGCGGGPASAPERPVTVLELRASSSAPAPAPAQPEGADDAPAGPAASKERPSLAACADALQEAQELQRAKPGAPGEAPYARGVRHQKAGQLDQARRSYLELIQTSPASPYVPLAYLAFAELFYREAAEDPTKLAYAEQAYMEVIKYPPPDNTAATYAHYQLAQVRRRQGQKEQALAELKRAVEHGLAFPALPCAEQVVARARTDIVEVYAAVGSPEKARYFFRAVSGDRGGDEAVTRDMVAWLAEVYVTLNRPGDALAALSQLTSAPASAAFCRREGALLSGLEGASQAPDLRRKLDDLARVHGVRCAPTR